MKFIVAVLLLALASFAADPNFVTPRMMDRRNGLTDKQYEYLWSIGRNPTISKAAARDWVFRASRYQNVTNWLDICGRTNNFAALSYTLQSKNFQLVATNDELSAINSQLKSEVARAVQESEIFSNAYVVVKSRLIDTSAKLQEELASLKEEKADLESKIADSKYILLRTWLKAKLAIVEQRVSAIEALTGTN